MCGRSRRRRGDGGADRVLLKPQGTGYRAHRVRARRVRGRAAQGACAAADCRRPGRAGPRIGRQAGRGRLAGDHLLAGGHLRAALCRAYEVCGFNRAAEGDVAFRQLVLVRIIESASLRDLGEPGSSESATTPSPNPARRPTRLPQADPPPESCALRSESGLKCRGTQRGSLYCDLCAARTCPDTGGDGHPAGAGVPRASRLARRGECGQ